MDKLKFGSTVDNIWSLLHVVTSDNKPTPYIAVRAEFFSEADELTFVKLLATKKVIGLSSYQTFPAPIRNPHQTDRPGQLKDEERFIQRYGHRVILWCHCFKYPRHYIPPSIPYLQMSETDHYDHFPTLYNIAPVEKEYDFIVSMPGGEWNAWIRGLDVAKRWINTMADNMGLRILVIGNDRQADFSAKVQVLPFQPWRTFMDYINKARALYCASRYDASPRILVEAMALNVPVLVNENILGGWKYVQPSTGHFFCPDEQVEPAVTRFMNQVQLRQFQPRAWLQRNLPPHLAQETLANVLAGLQTLRWDSIAEGLLFINLPNRPDRLAHMSHMLALYGFDEAFCQRVEAIENKDCGHLGCALSHIKALKLALALGWERVIIMEDDFDFNVPYERALFMLHEFVSQQATWDVCMLTAYYIEYYDVTDHKFYKRVKWGSTTAGYIVNGRPYMQKLLACWEQSLVALKGDVQRFVQQRQQPSDRLLVTDHAIDITWRALQEKDHFFLCEPHIGKQMPSPSSIMATTCT